MKKIIIALILAIAGITTNMAQKGVAYLNISEKGSATPLLAVPYTQNPLITYSFDSATKTNYLVVTYDANTQGVKFDLAKKYDIRYTENAPVCPGDVNGDGIVDIGDVNAIFSVMYGSTLHEEEADVNTDGVVDITDVNVVLSIMFVE